MKNLCQSLSGFDFEILNWEETWTDLKDEFLDGRII
jgi:hypothetical protein